MLKIAWVELSPLTKSRRQGAWKLEECYLMPKPPSHPVIAVPGITATALRDRVPPADRVGLVGAAQGYARVALHPDNLRYEAR